MKFLNLGMWFGLILVATPANAEKIPPSQISRDRVGCVEACSRQLSVDICNRYCNCIIDDLANLDFATYKKLNNRVEAGSLDPQTLQRMANTDMQCRAKAGMNLPAATVATPKATNPGTPNAAAPRATASAPAPLPPAPAPAKGGSFSPLLDLRSKEKSEE